MTFSGRNVAAGGGFSDESSAAMLQMLRQLEQETGTSGVDRTLLNIRQSDDYQELELARRAIEQKRSRVGNGGLTTEERQMLSQLQKRQKEMRRADARVAQRQRRQNRQTVPQSVDELEISPKQAEALVSLGYEPTAQGYLDAAADQNLQVVGVEEGRRYDWQGEVAGLKEVNRSSLIDREGDNAARMQNFGGVVGEGNRAKEGKEALAVQERADAEFARGEQDWDAKRERRQGVFRMPPGEGREGARPLGIEGFVAEQINLGNVDVPYGAQRGDAAHQAAVREEREIRAARLQQSVEKGFAVDTDDIVGEGFKAQDFGMERMDDKQIKLNRDFQRKIRNEDGSQAVDSKGRKRFIGNDEDAYGVDRNFRQLRGGVAGNASTAPAREAIGRLEAAIAAGELDPNLPLDYQNFGEDFGRGNQAIRKGPSPAQAADAEFRAREVLGRDATDIDWDGNLRRDVAFGREARRPEQRALEEANRREVLRDSQGRTVGQLLQDLREQVDGEAAAAADRAVGRRAVRQDRQAARGQFDADQRKEVIDGIQRRENLAARQPIRPFEREVGLGMDPLQIEVERRQGVKAARDAAGIRQVFAVDNEGGRQKNVQEMMLKQALEQGGFEPRSVPSFGEAGAAPALQFTPEQRAVLDQRLIDRAPQAERDFNNRRLVNDAKAGIEVVNVQINALARAARRKGSPLTSDEKQRILGALTQEIYPNQQIKGVSGKARFGRELVKGNFDNRLESFDYNVQMQPPVGNATPMYDSVGNVVGFANPANGQQLGAVEGTFDTTKNEWVTPAAAREMQELGTRARNAQAWAEGAVYDQFDVQNGDTFDENWPRQAVAQPLANVANKLRGVGFEGDIKNMDDLGRAFEMFVAAKGAPQRFDPERGAKVTVSDPNIGDMLDALHLSANEKKEVARAIDIQQKALDQRGVNASDKDAFLIGNDAGRNRALRIEGTKRRAVKQAESIVGGSLSPEQKRAVEIQAMKQLAPVQQAARDATMNNIGGAAIEDGVKVDRNGKIVPNRVGIAGQLRGLDPVARVNQAIEQEIESLEFARGERLSPNERLGVRQVLEQQNGIDDIDLWLADARKPFIGAIGENNKGGRAPREGANVQAGVMRVNINDDDAVIRQELSDRAARQRGNRGPRIFEIQGRRNLRDAVRADQAAAAIQQPIVRRDMGSSINGPLPTDLTAFGNQNRPMVDRWQGMEAAADAPMLIDRLSPREARERRILDEQRGRGITGPVAPNPNLEQVNAFDLRNRQVNDPAGMRRGGFNNGPFVGDAATVPMLAPVNDRIDNMANQIIGRDAAPVVMPRSMTTGIGRMPTATQAPAQFATSQQTSGVPNIVGGLELGSPVHRQQAKPSWSNPRSIEADPWTSSSTPEEGITREISNRASGGRSQRALPYGIQTNGPSQDVTRPLDNEMKNALAELSSGFTEQGPRPRANFSDPGIQPDDINSKPRGVFGRRQEPPIGNEANRRRSVRNRARTQRFGRGAAVAGGVGAAIAGIDGLIGGERERREEEQMTYMR